MTRYFAIIAAVLCIVVGWYLLAKRNRVVEFSALTFEREGKTVRYNFTIRNVSDRPIKIRVLLLADDLTAQQDQFSPGYREDGSSRDEILLGPLESRTISGAFELLAVPRGTIHLTPQFERLSSNQSPEPTLASVTPPAEQESSPR